MQAYDKLLKLGFTGIAVILLPRDKTVHKMFGLLVPLFNDSTLNIKSQSKDAEFLRQAHVFIWDETPRALRYPLSQLFHL